MISSRLSRGNRGDKTMHDLSTAVRVLRTRIPDRKYPGDRPIIRAYWPHPDGGYLTADQHELAAQFGSSDAAYDALLAAVTEGAE